MGYTGVGKGGGGGHGCCHDSHHPILHSEPEDQMPDQSIVHQADMHSAGHDGIYLPRMHINKIKKNIKQN